VGEMMAKQASDRTRIRPRDGAVREAIMTQQKMLSEKRSNLSSQKLSLLRNNPEKKLKDRYGLAHFVFHLI
jgi:hypothetical protein